jgi:hypothetical protein
MRRLVAASPARQDRDLPPIRLGEIGLNDDVLVRQKGCMRTESDCSLEHFPNDGGGIVDQLLHSFLHLLLLRVGEHRSLALSIEGVDGVRAVNQRDVASDFDIRTSFELR